MLLQQHTMGAWTAKNSARKAPGQYTTASEEMSIANRRHISAQVQLYIPSGPMHIPTHTYLHYPVFQAWQYDTGVGPARQWPLHSHEGAHRQTQEQQDGGHTQH